MSVDYGQQNSIDDLLNRGVAAAREKRKPEARALLREVVARDPQSEQGWLWLAAVAASPEEAMLNFRRVLAINPSNPQAQAGVRWAESKRAQLTSTATANQTARTSPPAANPPPTQPLNQSGRLERSGGTGTTGALFTAPAGVQPITPAAPAVSAAATEESKRMSLADWMSSQNQEATTATAPPSRDNRRAGFFDIEDGDSGGARVEARGGSNPLPVTTVDLPPTPTAPVASYSQDEYDEFAGLDDLSDVPPPESRTAVANGGDATPTAAPRPRSTASNRARELANIGAELDIAAGRASGSVEDLTSVDGARAARERRLSGDAAKSASGRAARPGLLNNLPLLAVALLVAVVLVLGFLYISNNQGGGSTSSQSATVGKFVVAYKAGKVSEYNGYLTTNWRDQLAKNPELGSVIQLLGVINLEDKSVMLAVARDEAKGLLVEEYYVVGANKANPVDFVLVKNKDAGDWKIDSFKAVNERLSSPTTG